MGGLSEPKEDGVTGFQASEVALEIGAGVRPAVEAIRGYHFRIAAGSAAELAAGIRSAIAWGYCPPQPGLFVLIDRELAMLWRLDNAHV
jgi:hypothetical protein